MSSLSSVRFTEAAQFGSGGVWGTTLNNILGAGSISASTTGAGDSHLTNTVQLKKPDGISGLSVNATFDSMALAFTYGFNPSVSSYVSTLYVTTSLSTGIALQTTVGKGSFVISPSGDKSYWKLDHLGDDEIIAALKDGTLSVEIYGKGQTGIIPYSATQTLGSMTVTLDYTVIVGRQGALIATF